MDQYIPYGKHSKKEKRKLDTAKRSPKNSKAYNCKKMQNWKKDLLILRVCCKM